jgi:hypothetical protein
MDKPKKDREAIPDDDKFREWYAGIVKKLNKKEVIIDPNPNDWRHYYDYRAAFKANQGPTFDKGDGTWHWPSKHKHDLHPNRYIKLKSGKWLDSKNDKIVDVRDVKLQRAEREIYERGKE